MLTLLVHKLLNNLKLILHTDVTMNLTEKQAQAQCGAESHGGGALRGNSPLVNIP